jgi:hypothetical protein
MARVGAAALAAVVSAGLVAGCGGSSNAKTTSSGVSATAYVTALCQAVAPFEKDVASRSSALSNTSALTASAGRTELVSYLDALAKDSARAVTKLKAAGTPQVTDGATFAKELLSTFTRLDTAMDRARTLAGQLSTSSPAAFKTGATQISTAVEASLGSLGSGLSTKNSKALNQAAAKVSACHTL